MREQQPRSALDREKPFVNLQRMSLSWSMATGVHSELCKSKTVSRKYGVRRSQARRNEAHCSEAKHPSRAGKGEAVAAAAVRDFSRNNRNVRHVRRRGKGGGAVWKHQWLRESTGRRRFQEGRRNHDWQRLSREGPVALQQSVLQRNEGPAGAAF